MRYPLFRIAFCTFRQQPIHICLKKERKNLFIVIVPLEILTIPLLRAPYPLKVLPILVEVRRKGLRARFLSLEIRRNVVKNEKIL